MLSLTEQKAEAILLELAQDIRTGCSRSNYARNEMIHAYGDDVCDACVMGAALLGSFQDFSVFEVEGVAYHSHESDEVYDSSMLEEDAIQVFKNQYLEREVDGGYVDAIVIALPASDLRMFSSGGYAPLANWLMHANDHLLYGAQQIGIVKSDPRLLIADTLEAIVREKLYKVW